MITADESTRGPHDVGGLTGFGLVPLEEELHQPWHESVMRMLFALALSGLVRTSGEVRYFVETLDTEEYRSRSYYGRWLVAVEALLDRARGVGEANLNEAASTPTAAALGFGDVPQPQADTREKGHNPLFVQGCLVNVHRNPGPGHNRLPVYVRGRIGIVRAVYPPQEKPTTQSENVGSETVYSVAFRASDLWSDGADHDEVRIDLFESYLTH